MQTIEISIEDTMLARMDSLANELGLTRSDFIHQSLKDALQQQEILAQERCHATGYARYPVEPGEFDGWENVRAWE